MSPYRAEADPFPQFVDVPISAIRAAREDVGEALEVADRFLDFYQRLFFSPDAHPIIRGTDRDLEFVSHVAGVFRSAREAIERLPR